MSVQVVIDSSVAYKWHYRNDEPGLDVADALLAEHLSGDLVLSAPSTLPVEIANALRYSRLPVEQVSEIIALIGAARLHLYYAHAEALQRAAGLAFRYDISVYDALFLELADRLGCPLYTSDRKAFGTIDGFDIRFV